MISWAVVAHPSRRDNIDALAESLPSDTIICEDQYGIGADANHIRAWTELSYSDTTWRAVIEDDAVPVPDVTTQGQKALAVAPEPVVSMYLGRGRPVLFQDRISRTLATMGDRDPHWLTTTHVLHAVAVAVHADLVEDWLDWAQDKAWPADELMTAWCIARGHRVAYTWPSIFDHQDGPSLIPADKRYRPERARTAWRTGIRDVWTDSAQRM